MASVARCLPEQRCPWSGGNGEDVCTRTDRTAIRSLKRLKGSILMHPFAHHHRGEPGAGSAKQTRGLILKGGWRYDLHGWFLDTCLFRGRGRELRQRTITLADFQPGEAVLDVGCGTGTLAIEIQRRVGNAGRVVGI